MSHFAIYDCNVSNLEYVKKALGDMGLGYKEGTTITDWYGQNRKAELAVVKDGKVLPLGWVKNEQGELGLQADWYVLPFSEKQFTDNISQLHSKYQVLDVCDENRWSVSPEDITFNEAGELEIVATQFA